MDKEGATMKLFKYPFFILLFVCSSAFAHVNSPDVSYQGKVGNYDVLINVSPPDVVPGIATTSVYIDHYHGERILVQAEYYIGGKKSAAGAEEAKPMPGAQGWFDCQQWFMLPGTMSVHVIIYGDKGKGEINIPVMAVNTANHGMSWELVALLIVMGISLAVLSVTIAGASLSDAITKPGASAASKRKGRLAGMGIATVLLGIVAAGTYHWCRDKNLNYIAYLYKPIKGQSAVFNFNGHNVLRLTVAASEFERVHERMSYVVPDHGKLMHLALAKINTLDAFAHLHPVRTDTDTYMVNLPPGLPAGKYFLYGDVVSWNGFAETIVDTLNIPVKAPVNDKLSHAGIKTSPDDAWLVSAPVMPNVSNKPVTVCGVTGTGFKLPGGLTAVWEHDAGRPVKAKQFFSLKFDIIGADGKPASLQPYMGMLGHAIVVKDDGLVYAHLHPIGSFAMASQQQVDKRMQDNKTLISHMPDPKLFKDSIDRLIAHIDSMTEDERNAYLAAEMGKKMDMGMDKMNMSVVQFPYNFPVAGRYRVWVEVKVNGKILTADFDVNVAD
jgi:hypothetical protein